MQQNFRSYPFFSLGDIYLLRLCNAEFSKMQGGIEHLVFSSW